MVVNSYLKPKDDNISSWAADSLILLENGETVEELKKMIVPFHE